MSLDRTLAEERTPGTTTTAVHYFGLLRVDPFWPAQYTPPQCCDRSGTATDPKGGNAEAVSGRGARLSLQEVPDGLGPLSETKPENEAEDEQHRDNEYADEVAVSENGCMGGAGRW